MEDQKEADSEFAAMQSVYTALEGLNEEARARVLDYVSSRLGVVGAQKARPTFTQDGHDKREEEVEAPEPGSSSSFGSFAELYDATQPKSQPEKALVGGYWLQVCDGADSFDSFSVNKELKNLGEGMANITSALDALKTQKPALCLQLKKAGKSRQARKTYKLTVAGIKAVEAMIGG